MGVQRILNLKDKLNQVETNYPMICKHLPLYHIHTLDDTLLMSLSVLDYYLLNRKLFLRLIIFHSVTDMSILDFLLHIYRDQVSDTYSNDNEYKNYKKRIRSKYNKYVKQHAHIRIPECVNYINSCTKRLSLQWASIHTEFSPCMIHRVWKSINHSDNITFACWDIKREKNIHTIIYAIWDNKQYCLNLQKEFYIAYKELHTSIINNIHDIQQNAKESQRELNSELNAITSQLPIIEVTAKHLILKVVYHICFKEHHCRISATQVSANAVRMEPAIALISIKTFNGEIVQKKINCLHCPICDLFYALYDDIENLFLIGRPLCNIQTYNSYYYKKPNDFQLRREYYEANSKLKEMGYNARANGPTTEERHAILYTILHNGDLSFFEVRNYLRINISQKRNIPNCANAVNKWEEDNKYVMMLEHPYFKQTKEDVVDPPIVLSYQKAENIASSLSDTQVEEQTVDHSSRDGKFKSFMKKIFKWK